ncbi:MAG: IS1380 family transposase [Nitrospinaceae bacterium]|jgi:hypothetical protein|nr:IS1380 family transposase [Nitrospinaceae bacterium]|tara:strand:- start:236 stop:1645 length:1410 start_codon:yes stop_codon:yes gene_type:complete
MMGERTAEVKHTIDKVEVTDACLTGRAGLTLISKYLQAVGIGNMLAGIFSFLKKSAKGTPLLSIFHQLICFFFDGTSTRLVRFDQLKRDDGYAAGIETAPEQMLSSHAVKRFLQNVSIVRVWLFRRILHRLFLWRLSVERPERIILGIDTMVMDNDEAKKREGVEPTYKKVKGFQPLQLYWGRYLIDAIFRNGKAHSNYGDHVIRMIAKIVGLIRRSYQLSIPIVLVADSGFFDQKVLEYCEYLQIGIIVGGKMYQDIKEYVSATGDESFCEYEGPGNTWVFTEYGGRRKCWDRFYRVIYTKPIAEDSGQILFEFARPETIIYTNLGLDNEITKSILAGHGEDVTHISPQAIISAYHERGRDELVNRGLKDFGGEQLPFTRFAPNAAFYYLMLISFFLFEVFKKDVGTDIIPLTWYATTFRRHYLDVAGKIVRTGRQVILQVTRATWDFLRMDILWTRCVTANAFAHVT